MNLKLYFKTISVFVFSFLLYPAILFSEELKTNTTTEIPKQPSVAKEEPVKLTPMDKYEGVFEHRLQFRMGIGFGKLSPAILNETGPAWFLNSIMRQANEPTAPLAIPYKITKDLDTIPQYRDITYGWKNKFEIQYAEDRTIGKYDRDKPASNNFFSPRTNNYWASAFEGNRLLRFEGESQHFRFSYTHPITDRFMIGPSINFHRYTEKNKISYGSYSTSRPEAPVPDKATWSIGGDANAEYSMKGILPGIYTKVKLKDWWEVRGRIELLDRKGDFSVLGSQIIQETSQSMNALTAVLPAYGGKVHDKGTLLQIESSFRYCRFSLDIGMIRQDVQRKYSTYLGDTVGSVAKVDYSARSIGVGFSEMSSSIKHTVTEFYIMPGVSFMYDQDGIY
ncbi:hypothetical protein [Leptospira ilyithenensis]|uniref:Uncharacterized protein n=1 Tax=Leptospira ilyithenensis TaxID=2484901 RepID=A0A4R9LUC2_9LEPT|nr:hypothetical protein [Leptospira ilyithenensis]TGN14467.1 hypothetical protein EHS11_01670 [Leptospira ilyithenensis]